MAVTISRLLIANRGEIACRIARTASRMGIETVGVYSESDRDAVHVDAVEVAISLGGSTPAESYLRGDAIIAIAVETGCDAVHPGYGFLAENADFAQAVVDAGLVWVGPTPDQIRLLGDKVAAKRAAIDAGVPTTPIVEVADGGAPAGLEMPALVKAAAGGGGRGMRVVRTEAELAEAITAASREAASAFGDGTVFVEPYIERGRHVEVQIMGDHHGNVVHLHERDCSVQRRNQKVIEEAPAPGLDTGVRQRLHDGALALARHVGYQNAGTVEFLVGDDGTINFLEVNTRLQVEHPVTEAITGLDLVELQLRVAAGQPLGISQRDVAVDGHAIEVRLVAEDPATGWLPSTGTITEFAIGDAAREPAPRVDTGVRVGSVISPDYDSLIAKVIEHADDRTTVCRRLSTAMRRARVLGVATNADCLAAILAEPDFVAGGVPTAYLVEHPEVERAAGPTGDALDAHLVAVALADEAVNRAADAVTGFAPSGWRNLATHGQRRRYLSGPADTPVEHRIEYDVRAGGGGRGGRGGRDGQAVAVRIGAWPEPDADGVLPADGRELVSASVVRRSAEEVVFELGGRRWSVGVVGAGDAGDGSPVIANSLAGTTVFRRPPRFVDHDAADAGSGPVCPLPGAVIAVHVTAGLTVTDGQLLMVVEAMKMEHKITAHGDHVVVAVRFEVGDRVDSGDLLVELAPIDT